METRPEEDAPEATGSGGGTKQLGRAPVPARAMASERPHQPEAEPPAEPAPAPKAKAELPSGDRYAAARWVELNDPHSPWWTRSHGMGIRLRLKELLDLADAGEAGATLGSKPPEVLTETREALLEESDFLEKRYGPIAKLVEEGLQFEGSRALPPNGRHYSKVKAALGELERQECRDAIVEELCAGSAAAESIQELRELDGLVELLDSELAFEQHPDGWRFEVAKECQAAVKGGEKLGSAIKKAFEGALRGWPKTVRVVIPVRKLTSPPDGGTSRLKEDISELLPTWLGERPVPEGFDLGELALDFTIKDAADRFAVAKRASDWLQQELALTPCREESSRP